MHSGLTKQEALSRLKQYGQNSFIERHHQSALRVFLEEFRSPLILMLIGASVISFFSGSYISSGLIVAIILVSSVINFVVSYKSQKSAEKLRSQIQSKTKVIRDGIEQTVVSTDIVPGDVMLLDAGDVITADGIVLESVDFFINEASLTGESFPVEKSVKTEVYTGSGVVTGHAKVEVIATGTKTKFYTIVALLSEKEPLNEFEQGIKSFSVLITRMVIVMTVFVFIANALLKHDVFESLIFSLALAVGLTPELLPMIIAFNVSKASISLSKKGVIIKKLSTMESFGSMDVLCTDKTGTLTEDRVSLVRCVDMNNVDSDEVFKLAYVTSYFHTGTKSPLDAAVVAYKELHDDATSKIDEIPFDFERRRNSIVATIQGTPVLISKGSPEQMFEVSTLSDAEKTKAMNLFLELSNQGYRILAVAVKENIEKKEKYLPSDEQGLTLKGFIAFIDPPKQGVKEVLQELVQRGISVKIITGDHTIIARKVAEEVGFEHIQIMDGLELDSLDDASLGLRAESVNIFSRVNPVQKHRIIEVLRSRGHVVGYLGDGINDAPSLRAADVGISVNNATDVAKESADIILMEKSLKQLVEGVLEGRRTFANTIKYITMAVSSNFGNMFSMTGASLFLPFLPMTAVQLLFNNILYEGSQFSLTVDTVEDDILNKPKPWDINFIKKFMYVFGGISSVFDFLTFYLLYKVFLLTGSSFQTGWFIQSFATQILVIFVIRSHKSIFKSVAPSPVVSVVFLVAVAIAWGVALSKVGSIFGFTPIPLVYVGAIAIIVIAYLVTVEIAKKYFYKSYKKSVNLTIS